jgi:5-histidylcysteine sulfoxide synthase/putative 4-mercaptohistidine N1-methyltranferase
MNSETATSVTTAAGDSAPLVTKTPLLDEGDIESKRQEILDYFHHTFTLYESLFECLAGDEAFYTRANRLRHPLIFYYGHTAVFFINKLNVANLIDERIDPRLESLLAIGVDEMSWDDLNDEHFDWPTPAEVKAYRDQTRALVERFIRACDFSLPIGWTSPLWIVLMGIEHERIHLETSSILIRELPIELVKDHPVWGNICRERGPAPENELLPVAGGKVELGKAKTNPLYGWDLEYGYSAEEVAPFAASKYLVSNREFLDFIEAGGYQNRTHWTPEGWNWLEFSQAKHPVYWIESEDGYAYRSMLKIVEMPWNWPVETNYLEAKAFCNWKSAATGKHIRLPTEAEWHQLRSGVETDQPYWNDAPGNINLEGAMSPCPVDRHEFHDGFHDILGNVWQWTETPVDGYGGYEVHPAYDDFSAPTFDGQHNLFKGGSWISTGNEATKDARYAFRRHFFQSSGFRYVAAEPLPDVALNTYETDQMVAKYLDAHYGAPKLGVKNFPVACIEEVRTHLAQRPAQRALDLGCAVGRASFELAKLFAHVDAVDFSARMIEGPTNLQRSGRQRYIVCEEGELSGYREIQLADFEGYDQVKDRIRFMQGDACNLLDKFNDYDVVFAGNLLERLYDPAQFLALIQHRIRPGGLLVLASTYTWQEKYTPRDKWLGGFKATTGENFKTLAGLAEALAPRFTLISQPKDIPFVIRETARKFQYGISELTVWEKQATGAR